MNQLTVMNIRRVALRALVASPIVLALAGCTTTNADGTETTAGVMGIPWWGIALAGLILLGLLWWLMGRNKKNAEMTEREKAKAKAAAPAPKPAAPAAPVVAAAAAPAAVKAAPVVNDDLTKIEGIGPKINTVLHEGGINTYAELAGATQAELQAILTAAGIHGSYGDPSTWPAQAQLAAAGKWDALTTMQAGLKGGRVE